MLGSFGRGKEYFEKVGVSVDFYKWIWIQALQYIRNKAK